MPWCPHGRNLDLDKTDRTLLCRNAIRVFLQKEEIVVSWSGKMDNKEDLICHLYRFRVGGRTLTSAKNAKAKNPATPVMILTLYLLGLWFLTISATEAFLDVSRSAGARLAGPERVILWLRLTAWILVSRRQQMSLK
jgi:hypothetical protein